MWRCHLRLYEPDQTFRFVYFTNEGLIFLVVAMANGKTVEAGIVGSDGVAGLPAVMQSELNKVALRLNQLPRKTLGFETPASRLRASVAATH